MLRRAALAFPIDWAHRRGYSLASVSSPGNAPYFIQWDPGSGTYGEDWATSQHDGAGTLVERSGVYHPIRIAQYALYLYQRWAHSGDGEFRERFLAQARWLRDNQARGPLAGLYRFEFAWRKYGASAGWCSAMAQGEAISVLLRAHALAPESGFADAAQRAAVPFRRAIAEGGVSWRNGRDLFFEEVANENPAHILNGCIFALWGLWELSRLAPEPWSGEAVEAAADTLRRWLPRYDTGWWTRYSLMRARGGASHIATLKYHAFHIAQMRVLAAMFDERTFFDAAERWESYVHSHGSRIRLFQATAASLPIRALRWDTVPAGARA